MDAAAPRATPAPDSCVFQLDRPNAPFRTLPPPDSQELNQVCQRVHDRLRSSTSESGEGAVEEVEPLRAPRRSRGPYLGEAGGFSLHVGVTAAAPNRLGRELLLRYCARPALALGRLSRLSDGRLAYRLENAYRLEKPWRKDKTHVVFSPIELLARVAALIPPPRSPLIRFHGSFAAHSSNRKRIVAASARRSASGCVPPNAEPRAARDEGKPSQDQVPTAAGRTSRDAARLTALGFVPAPAKLQVDPSNVVEPTRPARASRPPPAPTRSVETSDGNARANDPWRLDWHTLLERVHDVDALPCPCGGRLAFLEIVTERVQARAHLLRLGLEPDPPPIASRVTGDIFVDPLSRGHPSDSHP